MSEHLTDRDSGETVGEYAARMRGLIEVIVGIVQSEAGILIGWDDAQEDLDWIIAHVHDEDREKCWDLQLQIRRVVGRMTSATRLHRMLFFAQEMSK